ncbi:hypothetical protein [Roseiconus lacunae]|uniref:hypothetical protein n=1 Tax=Roseiconus lacunae TaxID=2605694 RepID=UPI0011F0A251|nr:hypothetical protein [Roseiconus lacunae]WRQ53124.1 hypothetical protein U8335_11475 [Stieleria sp. HD01]
MHRFRSLHLSIEHAVKQWRWIARLKRTKQIRDHWLWIHQTDQATPVRSATKRCLLDFRRISCDGEQGRRFHALVSLLARGGYQVVMVPRLPFLQTGDRAFKASALNVAEPLTDDLAAGRFDLCLTDRGTDHPLADRTVQVVTSTRRPVSPRDLAVPYSFYPLIWDNHEDDRFAEYRQRDRVWRLFFGGHCSKASYQRIRKYRRMQPVDRYTTIRQLTDWYGDRTRNIRSDQMLDRCLSQRHDGFVMIDNAQYRSDATRWLELLSSADFFVAAPGCDYPLSHNVIESIAVGTIPLLEYDSLLTPPLTDGVNCIAYRGRDGLCEAIERLDAMSADAIATMRGEVIRYYEDHLSPNAFCQRLESASVNRVHLFSYLTPAAKAA